MSDRQLTLEREGVPSTGADPEPHGETPGPPERAGNPRPARTKARMRARRRRMLLASFPVVLLVLPVAGRLVTLNPVAGQTISAFKDGKAADARTWAERQDIVNVIEPWRAPFAQGDAFVLAGDFDQARNMFEETLKQVPKGGLPECQVRVNLGLSLEQLGQKAFFAERKDEAGQYYQRAKEVVDQRPPVCDKPEGQGTGKQLQDLAKRIEGNRKKSEQGDKDTPKPKPTPPKKNKSRNDQGADPKQQQLDKNRKDATGQNDLKNDGRGSGGGNLGQNDPNNAVPPTPYAKPW